MSNNDITYVEFYNEKDDVSISVPVTGIRNELLDTDERIAAYDVLSHFLTDDAISNFVIFRTSKKSYKDTIEY